MTKGTIRRLHDVPHERLFGVFMRSFFAVQTRTMAAKVADAWTRFARSGNPNHPGLPDWPAFDPLRVPVMFLDDTCEVGFDHDREAREALAAGHATHATR